MALVLPRKISGSTYQRSNQSPRTPIIFIELFGAGNGLLGEKLGSEIELSVLTLNFTRFGFTVSPIDGLSQHALKRQ